MDINSFILEVASNKMPGHELVHKFGTNDNIGANYVPITQGGVYQTPAAAASLEIVSTNAGDMDGGAGTQVAVDFEILLVDNEHVRTTKQILNATPIT